jgi:hypothetical protein
MRVLTITGLSADVAALEPIHRVASIEELP